jgi:hypothetical protein
MVVIPFFPYLLLLQPQEEVEEHRHSPHLLQILADPAAAVQTFLLQVQQALQGKAMRVEMAVPLTLQVVVVVVLAV